ncbi:MAG TPA: radical SAM protein [Bdellovibrionota bacterium]|nr:radical SAM protein [Bdellovibrionota bacterium]
MSLTSRVDINVGYSCNERCKFCYYIQTVKDRTKEKDLPTDEVKKRIAFIRRQGIETLEFTGGEPTIRNDLIDLVRYAKSLGFKSISMISNAVRLAQPDYAKACVEAGIDDFLISIHGSEAKSHDRVTEIPGSFDKAVQAVRHLTKYPVKVRANCVISGLNYTEAVPTLELYRSLGLQTANFILFNPIVEADWRSAPELNVAYSDAAPYLKSAIDQYKDKIQKITVRYIPLCLMQGYESYVTNMPQIQYDPDEWDYLIRTGIREGKFISTAALWVGMALHPSKRRALKHGWNTLKHEGIKYFLQIKNKVYGSECQKCAYKGVCDGVWRKYADWKGFGELRAIPGPRIQDPTHFIRQNPNFFLNEKRRTAA